MIASLDHLCLMADVSLDGVIRKRGDNGFSIARGPVEISVYCR